MQSLFFFHVAISVMSTLFLHGMWYTCDYLIFTIMCIMSFLIGCNTPRAGISSVLFITLSLEPSEVPERKWAMRKFCLLDT